MPALIVLLHDGVRSAEQPHSIESGLFLLLSFFFFLFACLQLVAHLVGVMTLLSVASRMPPQAARPPNEEGSGPY